MQEEAGSSAQKSEFRSHLGRRRERGRARGMRAGSHRKCFRELHRRSGKQKKKAASAERKDPDRNWVRQKAGAVSGLQSKAEHVFSVRNIKSKTVKTKEWRVGYQFNE